MTIRAVTVLSIAMATGVLLAGCTGAPPTRNSSTTLPATGPITVPHAGVGCFKTSQYDHVGLGNILQLPKSAGATIVAVEVASATNAKILSQRVIVSPPGDRLFVAPWSAVEDPAGIWHPTVAAKHAHLGEGVSADLVTEVEPVDREKRVAVRSLRVVYRTDSGETYQVLTKFQLVLSVDNCQDMTG